LYNGYIPGILDLDNGVKAKSFGLGLGLEARSLGLGLATQRLGFQLET